MLSDGAATILAAAIAALVGLSGYLVNQSANRRAQRTNMYAEALQSLRAYQNLPHLIARRSKSDAETREKLWNAVGDAVRSVRFYVGWLYIHSPEVGEAYELLFEKIRILGRSYRSDAWQRPLVTSDSEMSEEIDYPYSSQTRRERELCLSAMRADLGSMKALRMIEVRRRIRMLRDEAGATGPARDLGGTAKELSAR